MSQARYNISLDLGAQLQLTAGINAQLLPLVNQAVNAIAQATAANWKESVYRAKMWSGEKDAYAKTITYRMTGDFTAVVESDYKYVQDIETGRPARDLKKMLDTSMKVRLSKKGLRYLIIPFRHNTPGNAAHAPAMPDFVYQQAKQLSPSTIVGHGQRPSGTGAWSLKTQAPATVRQHKYQWGDRLDVAGAAKSFNSAFGGAAGKINPSALRNYQGMVRMNTATGQGKKSSAYLTFRVMSEASKGWIIPAQPGQFLAKKVADDMRPKAEAAITEAIRRTMG
jgi:hypothetical protein